MKTMKSLCLAILALSLLAPPSLADRSRSNKGGVLHGNARAVKVQSENKNPDKDRDRSPDNDQNHGKHKGEGKGKHRGHTH